MTCAAARMVGTSALRDAGNRDLFCEEAARVIGPELELLSGQDEAALSFSGATRELPAETGPWLVADIGGGSTELVVGPRAGRRLLPRARVRPGHRAFLAPRPPRPGRAGERPRPGCRSSTAGRRRASRAWRGPVRWSGWPARSPPWPAYDQGLATYDRDRRAPLPACPPGR